MNTKWTDKITNEELRRITKQKPIEIKIRRRNVIGLDPNTSNNARTVKITYQRRFVTVTYNHITATISNNGRKVHE